MSENVHSLAERADLQGRRLFALVPCAGTGSRAGALDDADTAIPKQYARLHGSWLVAHTLRELLSLQQIERVLVVLAAGDGFFAQVQADVLADDNASLQARLHQAAVGGSSRAESVRNGLAQLLRDGAAADDWVLVHDAARCLVQAQWVRQLVRQVSDAVRSHADVAGGLLAVPVADTLKQADGDGLQVRATLSREDKWLAQTPQMFRIGLLMEALHQSVDGVTDEASAMEAMGHQPLLVRGHRHNFKVTYPEDFLLAEAVLAQRHRSGVGMGVGSGGNCVD